MLTSPGSDYHGMVVASLQRPPWLASVESSPTGAVHELWARLQMMVTHAPDSHDSVGMRGQTPSRLVAWLKIVHATMALLLC